MNQRPFAPQYEGDRVYGFVAGSGVAYAFVEWQPAQERFILSDSETRKPLGWVTPALFNQRVIGYTVAL